MRFSSYFSYFILSACFVSGLDPCLVLGPVLGLLVLNFATIGPALIISRNGGMFCLMLTLTLNAHCWLPWFYRSERFHGLPT
ncbi:hypothetical protein CPB86DRAFT_339141 [Serendipita vermifera]|nr:hypothetical protein CPB86DRAFT_339141 [Serendipita vermifera]